MTIQAKRYHDISCGHRVVGHEGKCRHLHGHNYRIHFSVQTDSLDSLGRVLDFSIIKDKLCMWLEHNWDHKFLAWENDTLFLHLTVSSNVEEIEIRKEYGTLCESIAWVPFNPTAENMAQYLVEIIGPQQLLGTGCELVNVMIEETRKCSTSYSRD